MNYFGYIAIIILSVMCSAFFSGSEIAFNASNKLRLKKNSEDGKKTASLALKVHSKFTEALSAILIGNNLANIAASTAATLIFTGIVASITERNGISLDDGTQSTLVTVISTAIMTLLILILGEITPKIIAKQHADTIVCWVAYPIRLLWIVLFPLVKLVMLLVNFLRRFWGKDKADGEPTVTEAELSSIIDTVEAEGVIDEDKSDMLQSALEFSDTTVEEIMTPRTNLVTIDIDDSFSETLGIIESSRYSRLPVYEEKIDNIIGILYLNHFYRAAAGSRGSIDLRPLLMKPCFLHKTMKLPAALRMMRERHNHIAVVIDEFGGTMGIVTLEDILEEIVGDIWDEADEIVSEIIRKDDGSFEVSGDMNIYDLFDELDFDPHDDFESEYSTVGGWATEMLQAEPEVGGEFTYKSISVKVTEIDMLRVTKLSVKLIESDPDAKDE